MSKWGAVKTPFKGHHTALHTSIRKGERPEIHNLRCHFKKLAKKKKKKEQFRPKTKRRK